MGPIVMVSTFKEFISQPIFPQDSLTAITIIAIRDEVVAYALWRTVEWLKKENENGAATLLENQLLRNKMQKPAGDVS